MGRTFLRTVTLMLLSLIALYILKQSLQFYTPISIAEAMLHIRTDDILSLGFLLDLAYFFLLTIFLHLLWSLIITVSCSPWFQIIDKDNIRTQIWLIIMFAHIALVLSANAYLYPTSLLGFMRDTPLASPMGLFSLSLLLSFQFIWGVLSSLNRKVLLTLTLTCIALVLFFNLHRILPLHQTATSKPNIFIIGIDGLRPDHLALRDKKNTLTPHLNSFIAQSITYDKTYTPQGRTYVAWMSLLTGQYPVNHGARFNLTPPELVHKALPLVRELKQQNYKTSYAMDERRFNQIDHEYGFENIIGPKIGAADAIIANIADFPLINLFVNTPFSQLLFPYLSLNRAYGKAYDPYLFNEKVVSSLSTTRANFLSVHFCQLHWPFTSKEFIDPKQVNWKGNYNHFMYQGMLEKVDKQFNHFIELLSDRGYLNNAIIYLISDHGEGFMLDRDKLIALSSLSDKQSKLSVNSWGHGNNVLTQEQSDVLMAYRRFSDGKTVQEGKKISGTFSLIDIAPSLFDELNLSLNKSDKQFDGIILPKSTQSKDSNIFERNIFVESSLPVNAINTSFIDDRKVLSETASDYEVRENGRAVLQAERYPSLVSQKQRSVYYQKWQLAMLPDYDSLVLVNTLQKSWQPISSYHGDAPWQKMLAWLCAHYRDDYQFDKHNACKDTSRQVREVSSMLSSP
ncbi:sulfatase-like hydrolase/transferase [Shewanella nanhaiensis]|nr:sulfatase-like hydrolase/transferase [Shewanella nanhaiensis]